VINITTRTTIVSNVQLDEFQSIDCWKRKGLSRRRKLENVGAETSSGSPFQIRGPDLNPRFIAIFKFKKWQPSRTSRGGMSGICGDDGMTRLGKALRIACNNNRRRSSSAERDHCVTRHARADAKLTVNRPLQALTNRCICL